MKLLADKWADIYQTEHNRAPHVSRSLLQDPIKGLEYFSKDGFARAGGEQAGYGEIAVTALHHCISSFKNFEAFIIRKDAPELVWVEFEKICVTQSKGINKRVNEGVIKGLLKLAHKSGGHHNLFRYVGETIQSSMTDAFVILRNVKGIGDKIAPFLLRDIVCILDMEKKVPPEHRIFLQPIDRWVGETAICLWADLGTRRVPSWGIAMRIVDKCDEFGISGVRFNQGAWKFGTSKVRDVKNLCGKLANLSHGQ